MDKQIVVYTYSGILFNHNKEWSYEVDEPPKHAKWKKPETKGHTLHDSIWYMKYPE